MQPRAAVARAMNSKRWSGYRFFVEEFFGRESWMECSASVGNGNPGVTNKLVNGCLYPLAYLGC